MTESRLSSCVLQNLCFCVTSCSRCIHKGECASCEWIRVSPATTCQVKFVGETEIPCDAFSLCFLHLSSNLSLFYPDMEKCLFFSRMIAMQLLPRGSPLHRNQRLVSILRLVLLRLSGLGEKFI